MFILFFLVLTLPLHRRTESITSGECSSSASKGAISAPAEPDPQTFSKLADEWTKFCNTTKKAAAIFQKAKTSGKKGGGSDTGQSGHGESKPTTNSATTSSTGKGNKCTGKKAALTDRQHWLQSYKVPKLPAPDTSVSSEGKTPRKGGKRKQPKKKAAKKGLSGTTRKGSNPKAGQAKTGGGSATLQPLPSSSQPLDCWADKSPGDDIIPPHAECVEWVAGLVLFCGTRAHPLILFEVEQQVRHQVGQQLRLWRVELVNHERRNLDELRTVGDLVSPRPADLPRLPPWAVPNGWDYWGRPWVYLHAPSGHPKVGVSSTLTPPSTRVTVAVLVDCPHGPQFLPDMVTTQSASITVGRATHQAQPLTQTGEILGSLELEVAAKQLLPRGYGDNYSAAILDQFKGLGGLPLTQLRLEREPSHAYRARHAC